MGPGVPGSGQISSNAVYPGAPPVVELRSINFVRVEVVTSYSSRVPRPLVPPELVSPYNFPESAFINEPRGL
jgi:hypothetical protein